jgi:hypothetical protein
MNIKYRSGYAEGGFLDDGASVDPVSGNEVPVGSLAEEVRDDVPAQLSEGEFVVPADVVRYIGLEKLMKMRETAKAGLANMEADGQMGGQPAPIMEEPMMGEPMMDDPMMDDSLEMDELIDGMDSEGFEGAVQQFAEGGSVIPTYKDYTGNEFGSPTTVTFSTYINAAGDKITIPTLRGKPLRPVPEGYTLFVPVSDGGTEEGEPTPVETAPVYTGGTSNNQDNQDFAQNGGRERQAAEIASSDRLGRERYSELQKLADYGNSQVGIDALWGEMTGQEKAIYDKRMRDPKWMDSFLTDGMSPADRMMAAIQTSNAINARKGLSINKSKDSMYSDKPLDIKEMAKVIGMAALGGIPGLLTAAQVGELGIDSAEVKAAARKFVLSGLGQGSGRKGDESIQPTSYTPTEYNQEYWKNFVGASSAEINAEKLRIARETGKGAYGNELTAEEIKDLNKIARAQDIQDKTDRTVAERERKIAYDIKEEEIQEELARVEAEEAQKVKDDTAKQEAIDREGRKQSKAKADAIAKVAREEAVRKAAEDAATQRLLDDQNRRQQGQSTGNGGEGRGQRQRDAAAGKGFGQGNANKASKDAGQTDYGFFNYGGLATKKKPSVKKMPKDNTLGLASKKVAKQKAQAKKGALAMKRT